MSELLNDIAVIPVGEWSAVMMEQYQELTPPVGNRSTKKKTRYLDCVCAFDIETTCLPAAIAEDQSIMYVWQFCVNGEYVIVGRTWAEYLDLLQRIRKHLHGLSLVIYVHNLSYEFQFLKGIYDFGPDDIFALSNRKIAKCRMMEQFEYRCSYIHSNMSLYVYTSKYHARHVKLVDTYDYDMIRYPWTALNKEELLYCVYDVQGLVEAVKNEMQHDGDTLYTIPLTSTGYVRRDTKRAVHEQVSYKWLQSIMPDYPTYKLLRECFRGGNTHANRYYVRKIVLGVTCYDRSSSYPDVILNCLYPITPYKQRRHVTEFDLELYKEAGYSYIVRLAFENIRLRDDDIGCPYLPYSKCRHVHGEIIDNGRILSADYLEHSCTDIDLDILRSQYTWSCMYIMECRVSKYGQLPEAIKEVVREYYRLKTALKGDKDHEILYVKSKNKLNSIYGMMATDPVKALLLYDPEERIIKDPEDIDERALLEKSNKTAFLSYAWGVYVTAWARLRLQEAIDIVGNDDFVYCDTDSVYYVGNPNFRAYNELRESDSKRSRAYAVDAKGKTHYMGVLEHDHDCWQFKTLGAKKYCYTDAEGLHTTIAGVVKEQLRNGKYVRVAAEELKNDISNFAEGFTFSDAGGLEAVYNDAVSEYVSVDGHELWVTDNVCLKPSTYTIGIAAEYDRILRNIDMLGIDYV